MMRGKGAQTSFWNARVLGAPVWAILSGVVAVALLFFVAFRAGGMAYLLGAEDEVAALIKKAKSVKISAATVECMGSEAGQQLAAFKKMYRKFSSCSSYSWMEKWQVIQPEGRKVVVDVGCGYGLSTSAFVGIFLPGLGLNKESMVGALAQQGVSKEVACGKCAGVFIPNTTDDVCTHTHRNVAPPVPHSVEVYCIDPSLARTHTQTAARAQVLGTNSSNITVGGASLDWKIFSPMALSDAKFTAKFPTACGTPTTPPCTLTSGNATSATAKGAKAKNATAEFDTVQVTTLDLFVKAQGLDKGRIDMLRINAEGYDPKVLKGAVKSLSSELPSVVVFEYKGSGIWLEPTHNLSKLVNTMQQTNYACYLDGSPLVFKLSHKCWSWEYGAAQEWTNVVCARRGHPVHSILESESHVMAQVEWNNSGGEWTEEHERLDQLETQARAKAQSATTGRKMRA